MLTEISIPSHPLFSFCSFKPVYTNAFRRCDYKFKISENTFAGHLGTVVDCMDNMDNNCVNDLVNNCVNNLVKIV